MLSKYLFNCLNHFSAFKQIRSKAALALLAIALLSGLSCGKRKPPLPPTERVAQRIELHGFQRGNRIVLSWKMPARNAAEGSLLNVSRADIYRLAETADSPLSMSEDEFASRSVLIATVPLTDEDFGLKTVSYSDTLEFARQAARLRYAVRFVNAQGQKAGFSNFLLIEPAAKIAANPTSLSAVLSQEAVSLSWDAPAANVDGSTPANIVGYNVYRSPSEKETAKVLNQTPVSATEFRDEFFEFDKTYYYFVRAVSVGGGTPVESAESEIVKVETKDTFAPSAPAAITVAAAPGRISIFFAVNPEKDIAGYRIFRSTDPDLAPGKWELVTGGLIKQNTFQDDRVQSGITYHYFITAEDTHGNVSGRSEIVSETAP